MKVLCGIRPSGRIHLGNYLGVIKPGIDMQKENDVEFMVARFHGNPDIQVSESFKSDLVKIGCENVYIQESDNISFAWNLMPKISVNSLERMTQYKQKEKTAFLLNYPILMTADIILSNSDYVLVGEDQLEHLEFSNRVAKKFGYKTIKPIMSENKRIMSLSNPSEKMSKSSPAGCLFIDDSLDDIKKKIRKAVTNEDGLNNLKNIAKEFGVRYNAKHSEFKDDLSIAIYKHFNI